MKDKVQKKQTLRTLKPLQQFQREEKQANNKLYRQDGFLQPNSTHRITHHNILTGKIPNRPTQTYRDR